jgi:branched-subunit amino acid aminotransferase/4-amino-4-deoxychorismate lyase
VRTRDAGEIGVEPRATAGADDALFLTTDGAISEATTSNVWVLTGRLARTPSRAAAVLAGTTRQWLLTHAVTLGLQAVEATIEPADLLAGDEAFLSSSVAGILPLTAYDGRPIGNGLPGPWTATIRNAREAWIDFVSLAGGPAQASSDAPEAGVR